MELAFTDAANHHWVRRVGGGVSPLPSDAVHHYAQYGSGPPWRELPSQLFPWPKPGLGDTETRRRPMRFKAVASRRSFPGSTP